MWAKEKRNIKKTEMVEINNVRQMDQDKYMR